MLKSLAWLAVPAALCALPTAAEAAPRSLAAATARLPETVDALGTSNLKGLRATKLFAKLFPALLQEADELDEGIKQIKKVCQIDAVNAIEDATMAGETSDEGAIFLALTGVDEAKAVACVTKIAKAEMASDATSEKISSKADGTLYRIRSEKKAKEIFFAWLPGEIAVVATDEDDKALLERMLSGKGNIRKSKIASRVAKLDPNATLSVVWAKEETIEGKKVKGGEVRVTIQGGMVSGDATAELESSKDAQEIVSMIEALKSLLGKMAPGATVDAKSSGANVILRAQMPEAELIKAADQAGSKRKKR